MGTLAPNIPIPMPLGWGGRRHGQANPRLRSPVFGLPLPSWKRDLVLAGLLGLLPLVFYTGILASDDLAYLLGARHGVVPGALPPRNMLLRFMHWAPLGMVIRLLPNQPWAPGVWSLIAMTGTLLVIGALARRLGVRRTWMPIVLFGLVPMNVILASVPLAEPSAALLAWLGILLCAPALLDHDQPRAPARCLAGGLLMAMSYSAKEPAAILIPSLLLFVLVNHGRSRWAWKRAALILVGPALWVGGEALLFWHFTGDPLYHAHTLAAAERGYGPPNLQGSFSRLAVHACDYVRWLADPRSDYGPPGPLLLGGLLVLVCRSRGPAARLLLCLVLPGLLYLSLGSSSLTRFDPLQHQSRHLLPILPGMALAAGLAVERLLGHRPSWNRGLVVATTGFTLVSLVAPNRLAGRWYYAGTFEAGRRLLAEHAAGQGHSRLFASAFTVHRFLVPAEWLGGAELIPIEQPPRSPAEWLDRYGGQYILTTQMDRHRPRKAEHAPKTLYGPSADALNQFPLIARLEPPADRLRALAARLLGTRCPTRAAEAVEIRQVLRRGSDGGLAAGPPGL